MYKRIISTSGAVCFSLSVLAQEASSVEVNRDLAKKIANCYIKSFSSEVIEATKDTNRRHREKKAYEVKSVHLGNLAKG